MGEIAEMMMDGTLCSECGCVVDVVEFPIEGGARTTTPPGIPRMCYTCERNNQPKPAHGHGRKRRQGGKRRKIDGRTK